MRRTLVLLLTAALGAAACGDNGGSAAPKATAEASTTSRAPADVCTADRTGGTLTYGEFIAPASLDPANPTGAMGVIGGAEMTAIYSALMRYNVTTGRFEPWVAQSLDSNTDGSVWTLKLRDGVVFGNGDPLNAAAVKASIERHRDPNVRSNLAPLVSDITDIATPDDRTVVFTLTGPWGSFPSFLAGSAGMIVDAKVVASAGASFAALPKGAGVGPYEPVKNTPNEEIVLQAKSNWWGGPVCIQQLRFIRLNGAPATYEAVKAGTVDVAFVRDAPVIAQARDDKYAVFANPQNAGGAVFINNRPSTPGSDLRIRQAIAYSIDPQAINQRAYSAKGVPTSALIGPSSRWNAGLPGTPYDPAKAKQLLQQVVAEGKYDGSLQLLCPSDPTGQQVALTVQAELQATGFKVDLQLMPTITQAMNQGNFTIACNGISISESAPDIGLRLQFTSKGSPRVQFKNPQFDAAVDRLKTATTEAAAKSALKDVQDLWNQLVPSVVIAQTDEAIVSASKIHGLQFTQDTNSIFEKAYIAK